jgi:MFS family permease
MPDFVSSFGLGHLSAAELSNISGWITAVIVLGGLIGALISAPLNDHLGRKWSLFLCGVI